MMNWSEFLLQICYHWTSCLGCFLGPAGCKMGYIWSSPEVLVDSNFLDLHSYTVSPHRSSSLIVTSFPPSSPSPSHWKSHKWLLRWEQQQKKDLVESIKDSSEAFSSEYALNFWIAIAITVYSLMCRRVNTSSHCWREIQMSFSSACDFPKTSSTSCRRATVAGNASLLRQ